MVNLWQRQGSNQRSPNSWLCLMQCNPKQNPSKSTEVSVNSWTFVIGLFVTIPALNTNIVLLDPRLGTQLHFPLARGTFANKYEKEQFSHCPYILCPHDVPRSLWTQDFSVCVNLYWEAEAGKFLP